MTTAQAAPTIVPKGEEHLPQVLARRLTVVIAGAGYGKSTLLRAWASEVPSVFHVCGAADATPSRLAAAVASLEKRAGGGHLLVLLDDLHELPPDGETVALVRSLVLEAPLNVHVVIASRREMPFSLARLRGRGDVLELDASHLRLTPDDVAGLGGTGAVWELTEGWPAAVRLALESGGRLEQLTRPGGELYDYLVEEVLQNEPPPVRRLLERVAPLESFTPELCAHLGVEQPEETLRLLERRGIFVDPAGEGRLRLHALVRAAVLARIGSQAAATLVAAAEWHESKRAYGEALRALTAAGDGEAAAALISRSKDALLIEGSFEAVVAAAAILPREIGPSRVEEIVGDAFHCVGDDETARAWLRRAEERAPAGDDLGLRLRLGTLYPDQPRESAAIWRVAEIERVESGTEIHMLAWAAGGAVQLGELERARRYVDLAHDGSERLGKKSYEALRAGALIAIAEGDTHAAQRQLEDAVLLAEDEREMPGVQTTRLELAGLLMARGRSEEALALVERADASTELAIHHAWASSIRGDGALLGGRLGDALDAYETSLRANQRRGYKWAADALERIGNVHRERGSVARARASYEQALQLGEPLEDIASGSGALCGLARVVVFDDPEEARRLVDRALEIPTLVSRRVETFLAAGWVELALRGPAAEFADRAAAEARRSDRLPLLAEAVELQAHAGAPELRVTRLREAHALWLDLGNAVAEARLDLALGLLDGRDGDADRAERRLAALGVRLDGARAAAGPYAALPLREASPLRIVTLGGFRLLHEGRPIPASAWRSRKARDLLKLLVANRGRPAPRDALMETLWPEDDPALLPNRLSVLLATIRHVLDPERAHPSDHYIAAEQGAVALRIDRIEVDVTRFLDLAAQALQDDDPDLLDAAERLYGGEFLAEDAYEDWATPLRDDVRNAYVGIARALARHAADSDTAVRYLERVLDRDRYDEEAHLELVGRLERAGRHGEARRRYAAYASRMDEIGVDPAPLPRD